MDDFSHTIYVELDCINASSVNLFCDEHVVDHFGFLVGKGRYCRHEVAVTDATLLDIVWFDRSIEDLHTFLVKVFTCANPHILTPFFDFIRRDICFFWLVKWIKLWQKLSISKLITRSYNLSQRFHRRFYVQRIAELRFWWTWKLLYTLFIYFSRTRKPLRDILLLSFLCNILVFPIF